ncbi:hypothetical protein AgCh_031358 [Apium graveolens]
MDDRLPATIMTEVAQNLRKEVDLNRKVEAMDSRLYAVENKVLVPTITFTKPTNIIDLINEAAATLRATEKKQLSPINWEKIDEDIQKKFGLVKKPEKSAIHHSQGELSKSSLKNPLDTVYETPNPDEKKLLARSIAFYKDPADSALKRRIAKVFRNGKEICVVAGHPQFAEAKREEKARLKQEKKIHDRSIQEFHGEPIIPMDELIDWDSLPIPELNLPHFMKPKKTKTRAVKKVKPSTLRSKSLTKAQPKVNKGDIMYICDIKEFSDLNLYLDELEEVRGIDAYRNLPERLVFKYKGGKEIQWPLHRILQESQSMLIKVYSSFKKNFGFNVTARDLF